MRSETSTIIGALRVLARDIQTDDGVVNACLYEAATRLEEMEASKTELRALLIEAAPHVYASAGADHMLDGFKPQRRQIDGLVSRLKEATKQTD